MSGDAIGRRSVLGLAGLLAVPEAALSDRAWAEADKPKVVIKTNHGTIVVELEAKRAPLTSANFLRYVDAQAYDGGDFYRAARTPGAPQDGQIVGQPNPKSHPFPPIKHESTTMTGLRHTTGTLSLGRFAPGTATSTFFICTSPQPYLDAHPGEKGDNLGYAAFGHVVEGMDVARTILAAPTGGDAQNPQMQGEILNPPVVIVTARRA